MPTNIRTLSGFRAVSDRIYLYEPSQQGKQQCNGESAIDPTTIIVFSWGDAHLRHVAKYASGYKHRYPLSRIVVVLCTLFESMFGSIESRVQAMRPVVDVALSSPDNEFVAPDRILVQIMSNSGAVSFIATSLAYRAMYLSRRKEPVKPFPHTLLVCDSVPGSLTFQANVLRWSHALAVASSARIPLPVALMRALWFVFLLVIEGISFLLGWRQWQVGRTLAEGIQDPKLMSIDAHRLYFYSESDELVRWKDVENHITLATAKGYRCLKQRFQASPHVGHMRIYPSQYWDAIARAWETAVAECLTGT